MGVISFYLAKEKGWFILVQTIHITLAIFRGIKILCCGKLAQLHAVADLGHSLQIG
jgi:hypothetical protein